VGRGHLILVLVAATAALAVAASAGASIGWQVLADGPSAGAPASTPTGFIALTRAAARPFGARLGRGAAKLADVDWSKRAVVGVFGEFGCQDPQIAVSSIVQKGSSLLVALRRIPPPPGTAQCMAIFGTYRLLSIPRSSLRVPYPTRVSVSLAGS
jgi:hypothetical protein